MATKLNDESITAWLEANPTWKRDGDVIRRTFAFEQFRDSIVFVNRVATLADEADHHPDIDIRYNKVHIGLSTHDVGGISDNDTAMAEQIDRSTAR